MVFYFWCSEKSQYLGNEMLRKMIDLLIRKPSLAELTGISDGRLNFFATQLRAYLHGSVVSKAQSIGVLPSNGPSDDDSFDSSELHYPQSSITCEKRSLFQQYGCRGLMTNLNHLDGHYPKSGSFEASLPKSLSFENVTARENLMQVGDGNASPNSLFLASTSDADLSNSIGFAKGSFLWSISFVSSILLVSSRCFSAALHSQELPNVNRVSSFAATFFSTGL
ncbi:uncharacterized protein LOC131012804 isoform X2 [Salvia miltiorrhiza]|uniref:uncharacterized protein LOC131012804 isoform X2 n=1 Tax=Salvia miltiorrhiza TaxID=226208 RepID=UPI0025AD1EF3|nr:uncharacterized protein LOC131012804 isoform X2 [Salvia miltiorrhiza]